MKKFASEFKAFIARGNVMDMAVGVIIGAAFKAIIDSLVGDIINPVLGLIAGGNSDLSNLVIHLSGGGDILLGSFLNAILNFLLMALVLFCIVKAVNSLHRKKEAPPAPAPEPEKPSSEELLAQILEELKAR